MAVPGDWRLRAVTKAATVQTIQAAGCMEVSGNQGAGARAIPREGTDKTGDNIECVGDAIGTAVAEDGTRDELDRAD